MSIDNTTKYDTETLSLIQDMANMYKHIGNGKMSYWGTDGNKLAPIGCLKCAKCMYDFEYFHTHGPDDGKNAYFCDICDKELNRIAYKLCKIAKEIGYDVFEIFRIAQKEFNEYEAGLRKTYEKEIKETKKWILL
jgi:hypothetical protein